MDRGDLFQQLTSFLASFLLDFLGKLAKKVANCDHMISGLCNSLLRVDHCQALRLQCYWASQNSKEQS